MKYLARLLSTIFAASAGVWLLPHLVADAVTLRDGRVSFEKPPRLVSATTPYNDVGTPNATYFFTLELPATASEPLQRLSFQQIEGVEKIEFNPKTSFAFVGTRDRQGAKIAINSLENSDRQKRTYTVTFAPPVAPGQTVTIALTTFFNPTVDGVYLIGVTAFPLGQQAVGQFVGVGRFQIYPPDTHFYFGF